MSNVACDYFVELRIGRQRLTLPAGRLWNFSVHRVGNCIEVESRHQNQQKGYYKFVLPDGL